MASRYDIDILQNIDIVSPRANNYRIGYRIDIDIFIDYREALMSSISAWIFTVNNVANYSEL